MWKEVIMAGLRKITKTLAKYTASGQTFEPRTHKIWNKSINREVCKI